MRRALALGWVVLALSSIPAAAQNSYALKVGHVDGSVAIAWADDWGDVSPCPTSTANCITNDGHWGEGLTLQGMVTVVSADSAGYANLSRGRQLLQIAYNGSDTGAVDGVINELSGVLEWWEGFDILIPSVPEPSNNLHPYQHKDFSRPGAELNANMGFHGADPIVPNFGSGGSITGDSVYWTHSTDGTGSPWTSGTENTGYNAVMAKDQWYYVSAHRRLWLNAADDYRFLWDVTVTEISDCTTEVYNSGIALSESDNATTYAEAFAADSVITSESLTAAQLQDARSPAFGAEGRSGGTNGGRFWIGMFRVSTEGPIPCAQVTSVAGADAS